MTAGRFFYVGAFAILAGFCGVGLTWIVVGLLANTIFKNNADKFVSESMPVLTGGWVVGFIVGLVVSLFVARTEAKTEKEIEKKYIGSGGRGKIYLGAPLFVIAALSLLFERLAQIVGEKAVAYVALGIALIIVAMSLVLYNRIPERFIIPVGIIGWLLIVLLAFGLIFL